jgi:hypothetical protein
MKISPEMKFNEALTLIYSKFGDFWICPFNRAKKEPVGKKIQNLLWNISEGFIQCPKLY